MAGKDGGGRLMRTMGPDHGIWMVIVITASTFGHLSGRVEVGESGRSKQARKCRLLRPRESRHSRMERSVSCSTHPCKISHMRALFELASAPVHVSIVLVLLSSVGALYFLHSGLPAPAVPRALLPSSA